MAEIQDIPRLVREFVDLAREYLLQETVEPAKKLGYFAGMSMAAGALWSLALILLSVAGLRTFIGVLGDGPYWEALAYVIYAVGLAVFSYVLIKLVPSRGVYDAPTPANPKESS
jgi:hypothetical protein